MTRSKHTELTEHWAKERTEARAAKRRGDVEDEWRHLERAHVLSQPMAGRHVRTHVAMLGYGLRRRDRREIIGQLVRLVVAAPGTLDGALSRWQYRRSQRQRAAADADT